MRTGTLTGLLSAAALMLMGAVSTPSWAQPTGAPTVVVPTANPMSDCPAATKWIEEPDVGRYRVGTEAPPSRVGWCQRDDGTQHGPMRIWWANGNLKSETRWQEGNETGPVLVYYDNGTRRIATSHIDGKPDGRYIQWHRNGKKAKQMTYTGGKPVGFTFHWNEAGRLIMSGATQDGKKHGEWNYWHANGVFREVKRFNHGSLHGRQYIWQESGLFVSGACYAGGEETWRERQEAKARTRKCRPF